MLRQLGRTTMLMTGVSTNLAVEGIVRASVNRGFDVVVIEDCCASYPDEWHRFSIDNIMPLLATVTSSDAVLAALRAGDADGALGAGARARRSASWWRATRTCADGGRFDDLVALFAEDGALRIDDREPLRGRDAIRAFLDAHARRAARRPPPCADPAPRDVAAAST